METHTLFELNEYIRRVLALNFSEPVWIKCEIAQVDLARGHYFMDLIEKGADGDRIIARANAVLWQRTHRSLHRKLGAQLQSLLQEGMEVMLCARVDFNERYGLKLIVEDIDPVYTLGQFELQKRQTLERLQKEELLRSNKQHALPLVWQNLAILSSTNAAGLQDFLHQLSDNPYGYQINVKLYDASLQGNTAASSMIQELKKMERMAHHWDCVIIIRGGGAKLDLAPFNEFELCKQIAQLSVPVITGIGHETDETIADLVAHTALKTPTAVADFILNTNIDFESTIVELEQQLRWITQAQLSQEQLRLQELEEKLALIVQQQFIRQEERIKVLEEQLPILIRNHLKIKSQEVEQLAWLLELLDLDQTLKRGYSLTSRDGQLIRSSAEVKEGESVVTRLHRGKIFSTIHKKES